jgi:hypothetical protein
MMISFNFKAGVLSLTPDAFVVVCSGYTVRDFEKAMKEITAVIGW